MAKRKAQFNPSHKISATFLQFAAPILDNLPAGSPEDHARRALDVAFAAWNAVIFADVLNDQRYIEQIRSLTSCTPEAALLVQRLMDRKRTFFADDERMVGRWEVTRTPAGINLRVEAVDPHSLPRDDA